MVKADPPTKQWISKIADCIFCKMLSKRMYFTASVNEALGLKLQPLAYIFSLKGH